MRLNKCPKCGGKMHVVDTRYNTEMDEIMRKRVCNGCDRTIFTTEFEVDCDEAFLKEWLKYDRNYILKKRLVDKEIK